MQMIWFVTRSIEELREKVQQWKTCMESKGLKINIDKTSDEKWER